MARLQILELPEGSGDDRPPFVLVVDQMPADAAAFEALRCDLGFPTAQQIGARAVLVFEDTIDIPANDLDGYNGIPGGDYATFAETVERALGIDTSAVAPDVAGWLLMACRELEKSEAAREHLRRERDQQTEAIERVRRLHQPVEHRGQTICWACSDCDFPGQTTDSPPVAYDQCATLRALTGDTEPSHEE